MNWLGGILRELRFAIRSLARDPIFTAVSVLTLSLAIGATTAIYTAFKTVLLDPLPFDKSDRLVMLWEKNPDSEPQQCGLATIEAWRQENKVFEAIGHIANVSAPYDPTKWSQGNMRNFLISLGESAVRLRGRHVSSDFFKVLRVTPKLGRSFLPDDDLPGSEPVAVISHAYWQRVHNGDSDILQKTVNVMVPPRSLPAKTSEPKPYRIVGVLDVGVRFPPDAEVWLSYSGLSEQDHTSFAPTSWAIARLNDGVSLDQARHGMNLIQRRLWERHPESRYELGTQVEVIPLLQQITGAESPVVLLALMVGVLFILLIACVNIAELLLARGLSRQKEVAVRIALGASAGRILRQLVTESLLLAMLSGTLGVLVAVIACRWLPSLDAGQSIIATQFRYNRLTELEIDSGVLLFSFLASVATAFIFGLAPGLQLWRVDVNKNLKADGLGSVGTRANRTLRNSLVVAAMAFAMVLVSGAGLMLESLRNILRTDTGFAADTVLVASIDHAVARRHIPGRGRKQDIAKQCIEAAESIPGVSFAACASDLPFVESEWATQMKVDGRAYDPDALPEVFGRAATIGLFEAFGIQLVAGRDFIESDNYVSDRAAIINERFAELHFPNEDPLGKVFYVNDSRERRDVREREGLRKVIVGVIQDVRSPRLSSTVRPEFYVRDTQTYYWDGPEVGPLLFVRTDSKNPLKYLAQLRERIEPEAARGQILVNVRTVSQILADSTVEPRFATKLLSLFAVLSLLLAAMGFYGVFAHGLNERKREIGIRMALGALPTQVLWMFVREASFLAAIGIATGALLSTLLSRALSALLVGVTPFSPAIYIVVALVLLFVVVIATVAGTWRVCRIPAAQVLRAS